MEMNNKRTKLIALAITAFILIVGGLFFWIVGEKKQLEADKLNFAKLEKEAMQEELDRLNEEYGMQYQKLTQGTTPGELKMHLANDSIAAQLISERAKVNKLLEELNSVKANNAKRIGELKNEVKTLRTILRSYVVQIDSLNAANERLRNENATVKENLERVSSEAGKLQADKKKLTEQVNLAAKLNATNISVRLIDRRGRKAKSLTRAESIEITFTVSKNITAEPGEKTFYARILNPNGEALIQNASDIMTFEGSKVPFSCRKVVEYGGEEMTITLYWNINQALLEGQYMIYLIADGNLIGQKSFAL